MSKPIKRKVKSKEWILANVPIGEHILKNGRTYYFAESMLRYCGRTVEVTTKEFSAQEEWIGNNHWDWAEEWLEPLKSEQFKTLWERIA